MKKIGITGSLASGKSTASKILSLKKGPLFSADMVVKRLYTRSFFKKLIAKKFKIPNNSNIKNALRKKVIEDKSNINNIERIIHPLVRIEMRNFIIKNKNKKFTFFEIPLLIESKLMKNFDILIFIKAKRNIRLKRFVSKGGDRKLFDILNNKQLADKKKIKYCDHVIVNEKNINILKKNLLYILSKYE